MNYKDLPEALIEDIIPHHFFKEDSISVLAKERIEQVCQEYSKRRNTGKEWEQDSDLKEKNSWPDIHAASQKYLQPVYEKLEQC